MDLVTGCEQVVAETALVSVDEAAVRRFADGAPEALLSRPLWDDPGFYRGPYGVAWLLAYNAVNFCYWPEAGARWWTVVDGREIGRDDEALGVMAALAHALDRGLPLFDGAFLEDLVLDDLVALLPPGPGAGALPRMEWRLAGLHELGAAYREHGGPEGLLARAGGSAPELVKMLVRACPGWEDVRTWRGRLLPFRKRAQLCVAMIVGWSRGQGPGALDGLEQITAFADYRLPQVLRGEGILRLAPELEAHVDRHAQIDAGTDEEIALRAGTIVAAERIRLALQGRRPGVDALVVDHLLWRTAVERQDRLPPHHRTPTTDY